MDKDHLVQKYMDIFYRGGDLDRLYDIFSRDLIFDGPLHKFNSARDYIDSLKQSPPEGCDYEIIDKFISENSVCLIYSFMKGKQHTPMAQTFLIDADRITKIRLIFNVQAIR